jgi:Holliday junction resolvase-like predicted endonuclease
LRQTQSEHRACRFDVLALTENDGEPLRIEHFIDAFVPSR